MHALCYTPPDNRSAVEVDADDFGVVEEALRVAQKWDFALEMVPGTHSELSFPKRLLNVSLVIVLCMTAPLSKGCS